MTHPPSAWSDHYVWPHVADLPAFRALIRATEHRLIDELAPHPPPVLDVGVGDGHFAAVALGPDLDVGIDASLGALREARRRGVHRLLVCARAEALPLRDATFQTIISNCVLEHVPDLAGSLMELRRVIRSSGRLIATVPTDAYERNLIVPRFLKGLGLSRVAAAYLAWFREIQVHHHLLPTGDWIRALDRAGFRVRRTRGYLSRRATELFEIAHYVGLPNLLSRRVFGRWVIWPWRPRFALRERIILKFVREDEHEDDSCVLLEATASESTP